MSDTRTTHLFPEGGSITLCCKRASLDERIRKDLGTYDPAAVTCPETHDSGSKPHPDHSKLGPSACPACDFDPLDPEPDDIEERP